MKTTVKSCVRCGEDHEDLEFSEFSGTPVNVKGTIFTLWAICPTLNEPILLREIEIEETTWTVTVDFSQ
jgi:hypothetical protein